MLQVRPFLRVGRLRRIARVEADEHHIEFLARRKRDDLEGGGNPVHDQRAQHRTLVVHKGQDDRLATEVFAERDRTSALVGEAGIKRKPIAKPLRKRDVLNLGRNVRRDDATGHPHGAGHSGLLLSADLSNTESGMQNADNEHRAPRGWTPE
jgi:hypothetical protein